jgi:predicted nucleic acid-binding protein
LIHALTRDEPGEDCRAFLRRVQSGDQEVVLTAMVAHEFTYAVSRYAKQMSREDIGEYLVSFMTLPAVVLDDDFLFDAVRVWANTPSLGFVDAYLGVRAERDHVPVFTKNIRHLQRFAVEIPDPLDKATT